MAVVRFLLLDFYFDYQFLDGTLSNHGGMHIFGVENYKLILL